MENVKPMSFVKTQRILFLVVILAATAALSLLANGETNAQTSTSTVSEAPPLRIVSASATAVELSWTTVSDAVSYDLRTWWAGADGWQRLDDGSLRGTSYSHQGVTEGRKYFYIVAGLDTNGRRGPWSARVEVTVPASEAPTSTPTSTPTLSPASTQTPTPTVTVSATPTSAAVELSAPTLQAEAGAGQITLRWGAVTNADSYQLIVWYRSISDWKAIGGVLKGTSYVHDGVAAGTTYYYRVRAVAAGGVVGSTWSGQVSTVATASVSETQTPTSTASPTLQLTATPTPTAAPFSAPALSAAGSDGAITLTWGAVANAESYQLIVWDGRLNDWRGIGGVLRGTSYTHGGLTAGTTHFYHVRAVGAGSAVSAWSAQVSAVAASTSAVTATPTITATPTVSSTLMGTATPTVSSTPTGTATPTVLSTATGTATPATSERGALVALFEATDGDNWTYSFNWVSSAPLSSWHDVDTDESGRVTSLALTENNLRGSIPDLSILTELTWLGLGKNWLTGSIPNLGAFTKLEVLNLNYNRLTGEIPELVRLTDLSWLFLNSNSLTGQIPPLSALTDLTWVDLSYNRLTGQIPDLSTLTSLNGLILRGNKLTGGIPDLSTLTKLERLELGANALDGEIPDLSALTSLERLNLGNNGLTGKIPDLDVLTNLELLDLGVNELNGVIPDLSALTKLTTLNLNVNELSGEIPDVGALLSLETLLLSHNQLTGPIPEFSTLTKLTVLDLSNNELTGPILNLSVLSSLVELDLSDNRLSGPVPDLSSLAKLESLDLSGNSFCLLSGASLSHSNSSVDAHLKSLNLAECTEADLSAIPGLPQNFTATAANGQVTLTWDGVANAATYDLWVWNSIDRVWGSIGGSLAVTTYTHSIPVEERSDRSYYYQVRARLANGVSGMWSERERVVLAPQQFPPPPLSLGLDILYQKYMEVGGVHVVAPSEVPDSTMILTREVITSMLSTRPDILEGMANYGTRIYFHPDVDGYAQKLPSVFEAYLPVMDSSCFTLIHEFAHVVHYTLDELAGGDAFNARLLSLYGAALGNGLWEDAYASWNEREYWAEMVRYWFQGSLEGSVASNYERLEDYDPEAAMLVEEVFGDATVPSECIN